MDRFWDYVDATGDCWLWTGYTNPKGYGRTRIDGRALQAHRVAYERLVGPIPDGLTLDHLCRVRACVNPDHLEPVTQRDNVMRGNSPNILSQRLGKCQRGHPWSPENTYINPSIGRRSCYTCRIAASRARHARRRAAA